jgi:hypothetical protein
MRLFNILIILALGFVNGINAQTPQENLKKYWFYRERLKNFVYVSSNYSEAGTNIPASAISQDKTTLAWDDGNAAFSHYISLLATEYRLLKNSGQDVTQTTRELYYAIKSFERLDLTAESKIVSGHSQIASDLNGYFLRNDVDDTFCSKYKAGGSTPYFKSIVSFAKGDLMQNSLDNCIHLLEAFTLVNKLVDSEVVDGVLIDFKQLVKDNAERIITNMYHPNEPVATSDAVLNDEWRDKIKTYGSDYAYSVLRSLHEYTWYLKNPITGELVPNEYGGGLDGTMLFASYGFAKVGNQMLGFDKFDEMKLSYETSAFGLSYPISDMYINLKLSERTTLVPVIPYLDIKLDLTSQNYSKTIFDLKTTVVPEFIEIPLTGLRICNYTTINSNEWSIHKSKDEYKLRSLCATGNLDVVSGKSPYEVLIDKQNQNTVLIYEQFPLIWSILNDNFAYIQAKDKVYINDLLNAAPKSGPYKFPNGSSSLDYANVNWSSNDRLVWPEHINSFDNYGYFSGLDYMLLHNLYWLANVTTYPEYVTFNNRTIGLPIKAIAMNEVTCSTAVNLSLSSVSFVAGKGIRLEPNFSVKAESGKVFTARIANGMVNGDDPLLFQKVSLDDYESGSNSLKSAKVKTDSISSGFNVENISIAISPNPTSGLINITISQTADFEVSVYNLGTLIKTLKNKNVIYISDLPAGLYIVKVKTGNIEKVQKVIKN